MNPVEVHVQLKQEDISRGGQIVMRANRSKGELWMFWVVVAIVLILPIFFRSEAFAQYSAGAAAMGFIIWLISFLYAHSKINKIWNETKGWHSPIRLYLSKTDVRWDSVYVKEEFLWDSFKLALETNDHFFLCLTTGAFIPVPKRDLKEVNVSEIREFLKSAMREKFIPLL